MNRIYQGRVTKVEVADGGGGWKPFDDDSKKAKEEWQGALWRHHELFQDAVNYYTLALAAMAAGVDGDSKQAHALRGWATRVEETWSNANRKAETFAGPQARLAPVLKLPLNKSNFEEAVARVLSSSRATPAQRSAALLQLLDEADKGDLNKVCGERIAFLCPANPRQKKRPTSKAVSSDQEQKRQQEVRRFHQMPEAEALKAADCLNLGLFLTQPPTGYLKEPDAVKELQKKFSKAAEKFPELKAVEAEFKKYLSANSAALRVPPPGRKPSGLYPLAAVFKFFPCKESLRAFLQATKTLSDAKDKAVVADYIAEARVNDQPHFDFFTNLAFVSGKDGECGTRAVWFEFDLAAFIEAIKAPHRYFQDTLKRETAAESLRKKKSSMEGYGGEAEDEGDEDDEGAGTFGFDGDGRIDLLRKLVTETLGYIAKAENPGENAGRIEYTIQERTLRGFDEIREKWRRLAENEQATQKKLLEVLAEHQTKHRDDFGSAPLYRALAQPEFQPIWRDAGTEKWHADDPLKAWQAYKELCFELEDKERPIRFTPAHSKHSPRYFIFPKKSEKQPKTRNQRPIKAGLLSRHESGQLSFTAGIVINTLQGLAPTVVRVHYAAPRLCRDNIRSGGDSNLYETPWLQPMMAALGLDKSPELVNFANCRITLQPSSETNIQLSFPVEVSTTETEKLLGYRNKWDYRPSGKNGQKNFAQFNYSASEPRVEMSLRWPSDILFAQEAGTPRKSEPEPWHEKLNDFSCLAVDLGQRDAGAFARLFVDSDTDPGKRPSRFIGEVDSKRWHAALDRSGLFRLPGEDAQVWRAKTDLDERNANDSGKPFDFRDELHGGRGRRARDWEADETAELMCSLEAPPEDVAHSLLPDGWRDSLTFPEQNDKLMVAMRRYQSRIARLHRWCWFLFLRSDDRQQDTARQEIADCDDLRLVPSELKESVNKNDPRALKIMETQLRKRLDDAQQILARIANRILPLRGRSWMLERHPQATEKNTLHHLTQNGPSLDSAQRPVWIRGQRGLSMKRIEQIEELRKRFQSLNQTMRRKIGEKPPIRRDESVPDPCPDLLEKLDNIKEQRVNQTAHMILAEALGLRLAPPPADKMKLRKEKDLHGVYEKILDKNGKWIGPVDFIVIEDLSRYRASQGRAPRENSRLMKWCHRAVRDKLKQLCEVFGLPVLETPAAYSSRFCSRSGVPGFRATEVTAGFTKQGQWAWLVGKKDGKDSPTEEAQRLLDLDGKLTEAQEELERRWAGKKCRRQCPKHTLLVPQAGGPIFVPIVGNVDDADLQPKIVQADINAAVNLGLRAIADPRVWSIHPRMRTQRVSGDKQVKGKKGKTKQVASVTTAGAFLATREKRKYGETGKALVISPDDAKPDDTKQPNFFADFAGLEELTKKYTGLAKEWMSAKIKDEDGAPPLVYGKSFWGTVKAVQWNRINSINEARLTKWRNKEEF